MRLTPNHITVIKVLVHLVSLSFAANLVNLVLSGRFGADPVDGITHYTGLAALNTLAITMLISPIARFSKNGLLVRCRRLIGLYAFFWATLHMLTFFALDLTFNFSLLWTEILSRPYLTFGAISWLILFALTITSTAKIQRRMGAKWQQLHNLVYVALIIAPVHFYWSSKSELIEPSIYILLALTLLAIRWKTLKRIVVRPVFKRT
ncbi:protein-methionine-sulfoxide reductase heme-binding subunit MsrQ [Grimontia sp. NTOU-MAR1]|uniref:protein-methionine-sulfoxide reductase heme-binding subunit MsrQ n=1 Tax=Grimontia sp. NTOU-MAR1 TaxID=3111011 RepID=UPI002DC038AD|nr:protein-methionine-sulfoxide reductase heme-binding subunit MsrQ [Grimontia sp. NTOU-MAR1]WRW00102.1 protein-methionine-sulfoxide reductase heme-binding subunit MsrQ [Grimontia sp. NTOU-MAR1]